MKVAVVGLEGFTIGKKNLPDERLDRLKEILHSPKVTSVQIEFQEQSSLKNSDCILVKDNSKLNLVLEDLDIVEARLSQEKDEKVLDLLKRAKSSLEQETLLCELNFSNEEKNILLNYNLVTIKPVVIAGSQDLSNIPKLIQRVYKEAGMLSFFTSNERELRAWQLKAGTSSYEAAGCIHSDIQRGFIKAEVMKSEDIIKQGGLSAAKSKDLMKLEDRDYIVKDGDWINFRFNI